MNQKDAVLRVLNRMELAERLDFEDGTKAWPQGLAHTVLALQLMWQHVTKGGAPGMSADVFVRESEFVQKYEAVLDRYKANVRSATSKKHLANKINDIVNHRTPLHYFQLRAWSDLVDLPVGVFLLFTQFVSREKKAIRQREDPRAKALAQLARLRALADAIEDQIMSAEEGAPIFTELYRLEDGREFPFVKADHLKAWADAFNADEIEIDAATDKADAP